MNGGDGTVPDALLEQDEASRVRALELASFIVEAPAGAGKTELLTQRYLKLLDVVEAPEEIVAITFTNKAAAEMRGRVLQSLREAADAIPVDAPHKAVTRQLARAALARSSALGWNLLTQPARLRITTIDALCSLLARQMPLLSRFGSQPGVCADATLHYREAARRTLAMLENQTEHGPVGIALAYFDNDTGQLSNLLADMLAKRDQWLHHTNRPLTQEEAETALRHLVRHDLAQAAAVLTPELQTRLMPVARYAASNLPCDHPLALLSDWETPLTPTPEALPLWRAMCELLLTGEGSWRRAFDKRLGFPATEEGRACKEQLLEILAGLPDPQPLARIQSLPEVRRDDAEWRIVGALASLLQQAAGHLLAVFQEVGEVDFVEVASRALYALEDEVGPTDLALRLDYRIQHLLVDEFQDTSPTQVKLLERLTAGWAPGDGRTLFCVGDPMQSIYRFRKAEVGLFLQAERYGIGHLRLECLRLTRNNRSCPAVVQWVNDTFRHVFPSTDSETRGAICYRPFIATRPAEAGDGVFVHPLRTEQGATEDQLAALEARHVVTLIEQERAAFPDKRIAVLVRARTHLDALVAEIRRHYPGLKFQAVEVEALAGRQVVQDALTLVRALLHRADRVSWLALLRAPWCGLTLADLHTLAADDHDATVWQLMHDASRLARMSEDGRRRLLYVRGVLEESFAHQGRQPVRRWVESAWLRLGGPHCLWDAGDVRDVQTFFDLVERLARSGRFAVDELEKAMAELYAAPEVQAEAYPQFMTLHKSKGLEFDSVILLGLHRLPKGNDVPLVLWEEVAIDAAEPQLVAAPWVPRHRRGGLPSAYDYLRRLEAERAANEAARVLYVGATRAKQRLHLVAAVAPNAKGELKPPAGSFLERLWDAIGTHFTQAMVSTCSDTEEVPTDFIPRLVRLPQPALPELLAQVAPSAATPGEGAIPRPATAQGNLEADCGTLAHLYLEMMAGPSLADWTAVRLQALRPAMVRWLQRQGHREAQARQGADRVLAALCRTLSSSDGQWVLRDRLGAASELVVAESEGGRTVRHGVDRTFIEGKARWVIDYKLEHLDEEVTEATLRALAERHRPQLERYAGLFAGEGLPVRKAVLFLEAGRLVEL
ncbi:MAG: UvrD-helicase domain-containing protein [Methylophilaceae bacterium]|nr:UvrD-helicase domain-containing protein [Methylophilaceae bacterium]